MSEVKVGDVVRVSSKVQGTHGKRFTVIDVVDDVLECKDVRDLRHRWFKLDEVRLDKKAIDPFAEAKKRQEAR